ncbi:T9SS type A sorting domain-containing protein [Dyadobacter diqingensis]|uniref:T9SS type A sorting domain-containing protein n=1 Tax=Dyadobacter diqingensis TaxID=2938121 RepID=UPI0020C3DE4B|nr:T9SS type A sorting domain-containing protein [Dyadobacter diqingensis]
MAKIIRNCNVRLLMFCILSLCLTVQTVSAQGGLTITSPATVVQATCPSNGGFTIHDNGGAGVVYQITSGPAGYPPGAQDSNTFADLLPGEYTVKVYYLAEPTNAATENITILDQYVDVTANSVVSKICTSATPGGTITTTASNGSPAYQYAYFQGDPGMADNDPAIVYGTSNIYVALTYGTYNVRVKDACGVFVTQQVSIEKSYPEGLCINQAYPKYYLLNCDQVKNDIYVRFYLANGVDLASLPDAGIDIDVYYNTGTCDAPVEGSFVKTVHFGPTSESPDMLVPNKSNLIFKLRTPCGDVCSYCYEYDPAQQDMDVAANIEAIDCPATPGGPINYGIYADVTELSVIPITYVLTNSSGVVVDTYTTSSTDRNNTSAYFNGLTSGTYTVTATDACGKTDFQVVTPEGGTPGVLTGVPSTYVGCATINDRTTMNVKITGVMANLAGAVAKIIAPSTSGVGTVGFNGGGGNYIWADVIPGGTYTIQVDNQCGQTATITVTLPMGNVQDQHINATVEQLCGGTGNVNIDLSLEGNGSVSFDLLDAANNIVGSGTAPGGSFINLPAGTYHAVAHVMGCGPYDFTKSDIVILPGGSLPVITKKLGVYCETGTSKLGANGKAILAFYGAQPLKVDFRLTSGTDADYVNLTNDSDGTETIDGLETETSYTIRVTDACGNSTVVQVSTGLLGAISTENTDSPCIEHPYTLSVPDMVDATYSWTKDGVFISGERVIDFPSYAAGDNGTYVCTIVVAGCVTRTATTILNSANCTLPVTLVKFQTQKEGNAVLLNWSTTMETNADHFNIERSHDAKEWKYLGAKPAKGESNGLINYSFTDISPLPNLNYYRLKMIDKDGTYAYSRIQSIDFDGDAQFIFYPNPASKVLLIKGQLSDEIRELSITNLNGVTVYKSNHLSPAGVSIENFPNGMYLIKAIKTDGTQITHKVVVNK